jgi:hypothetical protein
MKCNDASVCLPPCGCLPWGPCPTVCTGHCVPDCNDNNACTIDAADPATGTCVHTLRICNDNNACTYDMCNTATGCVFTPISVSDGNPCTIDSCNPATGSVYTPKNCSDNDACTADSCDPATGICVHTQVICNDGNACTIDSCDPASGCKTAPVVCNDSNTCTSDSCDPATGCVYTPLANGAACTINNTVGTCQSGVCQPPTSTCPPSSVKTLTLRGGGSWWDFWYDKQIQTNFSVMNNGCILRNRSTTSKIVVTPGTVLQVNWRVGTGPHPTTGYWKGVKLDTKINKTIVCPSTTGDVGHLVLDNYKARGGYDKDDMTVRVQTN